MNRKAVFFSFVLLALAQMALSQANKKSLAEAERFFGIKAYDQALPLFIEAINAGEKNPSVHYKAGVCYQKTGETNQEIKAIPLFEYALANGKDFPPSVYFDLGYLYLKDESLQKALNAFNTYKGLVKADKAAVAKADQALNTCNTAIALMSVPRNIPVSNFGSIINTQYTEYNPVVSADESIMAFTALRPNTGKTRSGDKFIEEIYISYNNSGTWSEPKLVPVASEYNVGTAGISPDGQKMLIYMGAVTDPGSLFQITRSGESWSKPGIIAPVINTPKYLESTASITPDGKTIYFASDKAGGFGGLDIYKTTLQNNGTWSSPVNLGPAVNSKANEDAPFIHPDQKTLFFTSDGHNSMGGRDIFVTKFVHNKWTAPENMGYPVNTTANDNYFTLIADGTRGYFSSDRKGGAGGQDIYFLNMPAEAANIPLTMIKGKILNAETGKPMPTKIYLIDNQTNKKLDFVYNPDPETGNYLVILPPAKNYDMVIESEGFLPYTLNINVPNQDYFYELYQMISLKTIKQFDVVVGQEVQVKNAFYDTDQDVKADLRKTHEAKLVQTGNVDVYDMMLDLMAAKDKDGIEYLVGLIEHKDPVEAVNFDDPKNSKIEVAARTYYYDESDESKFEQKNVGGKTIFSLPTMIVAEEAKKQRNQPAKKATEVDKSLLAKAAKIYFDAGKSDLKTQYNTELDNILEVLKKYPDLGVEISGFASAEGSEDLNRELSNKRAIAVLDYINHRGVVRRRIVAKGYGASKDQSSSKEEGRRVEVRIVDLNAITISSR
ncbi:OmpA family protein [Chryseosolibacter indicus]|uniref:PD40 domain-containing protein n=1 Tax=Chryseosolibacter indicus TaxID=2782351 RepID=A0ABS5VVV9_9BACT|nr:OmpA family protein [Chryseosolibacter indicus]MBT1704854.1 PD40 domain-containing protein [Chryseosolibacter indicus]